MLLIVMSHEITIGGPQLRFCHVRSENFKRLKTNCFTIYMARAITSIVELNVNMSCVVPLTGLVFVYIKFQRTGQCFIMLAKKLDLLLRFGRLIQFTI